MGSQNISPIDYNARVMYCIKNIEKMDAKENMSTANNPSVILLLGPTLYFPIIFSILKFNFNLPI